VDTLSRVIRFLPIIVVAFVLVASACGAEGPEALEETPPPPLTYVSLGDSLAVGVGARKPERGGYAPLYRSRLERETGRDTRLVQLGVSGETSESFLARAADGGPSQLVRAREALRRNPGAVVTLSLGGNDLLRAVNSSDTSRERAVRRYGENLDRILKTLSGASDPAPRVVVLTLYNPAPGPTTEPWVRRMNAEIRHSARENGAAVAPVDRAFRGREGEYARPYEDIHPTDTGYRALEGAIADAHSAREPR
jgi:lysophospholipase L1-like esterase